MNRFFFVSVILLLFIFNACTYRDEGSSLKVNEKIRVILDTDANNEMDDQNAIACLLFNDNVFDIEGITVNRTYNGGDVNKHFEEAERIVKLCGFEDRVRVYRGANGTFKDIIAHINEEGFDGHEAVDFIIQRAKESDKRRLVLLGIGKLTNIALAIYKDPSIVKDVRVVWLGSNYPMPGEYNLENDTSALGAILKSDVQFEMVVVRYGENTGADAAKVDLETFRSKMKGIGPRIEEPIVGRHGGEFNCIGDYLVNLFENFPGRPKSRPLFDVTAVAILKNPSWADRLVVKGLQYVNGRWEKIKNVDRSVVIWENLDCKSIISDYYNTFLKVHN
ncbi:MAG: nucleoside hydrolase [Candidatus Marinimicrobia bacterium]|nr:nucleoside hydrolase [Candidatus Neomarinimicrobiota bacterium]